MNGLILSLDEFQSLPGEKKLDCLYYNQVKTMDLIKGYKFYYKITVVIITALSAGVIMLFKLQLTN